MRDRYTRGNEGGRSTSHHSHSVLIIDDDSATCEAFGEFLRGEGILTDTASSAAAVRELTPLNLPCVVLLDYRIPGFDADTFVLESKTRFGAQLAVLLVTGDSDGAAKLRHCVADVLLKPVDPLSLVPLINHHCRQH